MLIEQVDSLQKECTVCSKAKDHIGDRLESCLRELKQNGEHLDQMKAEALATNTRLRESVRKTKQKRSKNTP